MNIKNKKQIYWACRRGIRELEILITTFFENKYDNLTNNDKYAFIRFLNYDDRSMINLLINTNLIDKKNYELYNIIKLINKSLISRKLLITKF